MRSRGNGAAQVFDADAVATQFGVVQSSYQASPLEPCDVVEVRARYRGLILQCSSTCGPRFKAYPLCQAHNVPDGACDCR